MPHDANHDHDHGSELNEMQRRVKALETVLAEKGYINPDALDKIVEAYEHRVGPHIGAKVVAHAWTNPDFKKALQDSIGGDSIAKVQAGMQQSALGQAGSYAL